MTSCGLSFTSFRRQYRFYAFYLEPLCVGVGISIMGRGVERGYYFPLLRQRLKRCRSPSLRPKRVFAPRISGSMTGRSLKNPNVRAPRLYHCALSLFQSYCLGFSRIFFFLLVRAHALYRCPRISLSIMPSIFLPMPDMALPRPPDFSRPVYLIIHGNSAFLSACYYPSRERNVRDYLVHRDEGVEPERRVHGGARQVISPTADMRSGIAFEEEVIGRDYSVFHVKSSVNSCKACRC